MSHTHGPGEEHSHSHGPPVPPGAAPTGGAAPNQAQAQAMAQRMMQQKMMQQQQQQMQVRLDPAAQALIDQQFVEVPLHIVTEPLPGALCTSHKKERCDECGVNFVDLNRLSRLLAQNPGIKCPPPPNMTNTKNLTQTVNNLKEEGNVRVSATRFIVIRLLTSTCGKRRNSTSWDSTRQPLHATAWLRSWPPNDHHSRLQTPCGKNSPSSSPTEQQPTSVTKTTSPLSLTARLLFKSVKTGPKVTYARQRL